jgi:hypothetical protein
MLVELYNEIETNPSNKEEMELHLELAKELGLATQASLHTEQGVDSYRKMTAEELFVFGVNFPNVVPLSEYKSLIPIRMLVAIKDFIKVHPTLKIFLLCPEPGKPDPIVTGGQYYFQINDHLLIGRFGEALEDFSTLRGKAIESILKKLKLAEMWNYKTLSAIHNALKND